MTTFVPLRFKRHGVRKVVMHAEPVEAPSASKAEASRVDPLVVKAIAQGLYWQKLLHEHKVKDAAEIARVEGTDRARVTKITKLALLAPDVIAALVDGRLPMRLQRLLREEIPYDWRQQRQMFGGN
ncbi:hypothetical protein OOT46_22870 [Aquabacterium sp. A7-Y]|uniref:hypothetical protein n=1 Tax=Aquabacterium sp. A7-Y TaxID=1349605 RepID=UPI00223E70DD|nr:hypothetical protein [Aquabacterium sp. A7-Y]MCW7540666.1 hypothetical protein [Aquabacterium sp. A7-Y]